MLVLALIPIHAVFAVPLAVLTALNLLLLIRFQTFQERPRVPVEPAVSAAREMVGA